MFQLLLPLTSHYVQRVSDQECIAALHILHEETSAASWTVSLFATDTQDHQSKPQSFLMSCFPTILGKDDHVSRCENTFSNQQGRDVVPFLRKRTCRLLVRQNFKFTSNTKSDDQVKRTKLTLIVEIYALNMILTSRIEIPFQDIVEFRVGFDACQYRHIKAGDPKRVGTLFSKVLCLGIEFDSVRQQQAIAECIRKISAY